MKNIEKHFRDILHQSENTNICQYIRSKRTGKKGNCTFTENCKLCHRNNLIWLNQEIFEPVKLTKFEYSLLMAFASWRSDDEIETQNMKLSSLYVVQALKKVGYFQNVDLEKTLWEVLEKCEVKSDVEN